jgi:hypothetical protein
MGNKRNLWIGVVLLAVFALAGVLRGVHLRADPVVITERYDHGFLTDEGFWTYPARSQARFGWWIDPEFPWNYRILLAPVFQIPLLLSFKLFGAGFLQARLVSVLFSMLTLVLVGAIIRDRFKDWRVAAFGFFVLGFNFLLVSFNRMALLESTLLFFIFLALFFWLRRERSPVYSFLAGAALVLAVLTKGNSFVVAAALGLVSLLEWGVGKKPGARTRFLCFLGGLALYLVWNLGVILPNLEAYRGAMTEVAPFVALKEDLPRFYVNLSNSPSFHFYKNFPVLSSAFVLFAILYLSSFRRRARPMEHAIALWVLLGSLLVGVFHYQAVRFSFVLIPPLLLSALVIVSRYRIRWSAVLPRRPWLFLVLFAGGFLITYLVLGFYPGAAQTITDRGEAIFKASVNLYPRFLSPALIVSLVFGWVFALSEAGERRKNGENLLRPFPLAAFLVFLGVSFVLIRDFPYLLIGRTFFAEDPEALSRMFMESLARIQMPGALILAAVAFVIFRAPRAIVRREQDEKGFNPWLAGVLACMCLIAHVKANGTLLTRVYYSEYNASRKIGRLVPKGSLVYGRTASTLSLENQTRVVAYRMCPDEEEAKLAGRSVYALFEGVTDAYIYFTQFCPELDLMNDFIPVDTMNVVLHEERKLREGGHLLVRYNP